MVLNIYVEALLIFAVLIVELNYAKHRYRGQIY